MIDNKHRDASWKDIAMEFKSERDALRNDVFRLLEERDALLHELETLRNEIVMLRAKNE